MHPDIWQHLPAAKKTPQPKPMEDFGQNQGLMLYRTILTGHHSGKLKIWEPHDYALVFLNGEFIDTVYREGGNWTVDLPKTDVANPQLDILVEGMGHINFAQFMIDRKGNNRQGYIKRHDIDELGKLILYQWMPVMLLLLQKFQAKTNI